MSNGNEPVYPGEVKNDDGTYFACWSGMTKREKFASQMMSAYLSNPSVIDCLGVEKVLATAAVKAADALLSALAKEGGSHE